MTATSTRPDRTSARTLPEILAERARETRDHAVCIHLVGGEDRTDELTYGELYRDASSRAGALVELGLAGERVVLAHDTGLDFVRDLFACFMAGAVAVPVQVPRGRYGAVRLHRIHADADAGVVLTTGSAAERFREYAGMPEMVGLRLVDSATFPDSADWQWGEACSPDDLALLQYTSGSTGQPKGVEVTHRNFWHNTADILAQWPVPEGGAIASWLPLFHDLGLTFGALLPVRAGVPVYLMSPGAFIRRPLGWLEAVSRRRVTHIAAPDFAYQLCLEAVERTGMPVGLDLSSCVAALNGAEPVRWTTVGRFAEVFAKVGFRASAPSPAYGLAEATLHVTGTRQDCTARVLPIDATHASAGRVVPVASGADDVQYVVSCGAAVSGTVVRIVDPVSCEAIPPDRIGEIWVRGPGVAHGYWRRPAETVATFSATVTGEDGTTYLRTGDLGFLYRGELYVCGRHKDVLIRNGRNYYPSDIERIAEGAHPLLRASSSTAFAVVRDGGEQFVLVIEVDGRILCAVTRAGLAELITSAVKRDLRVVLDEVVIIKRGALAKTTSGKVQRGAMRQQYLDGTLKTIARDSGGGGGQRLGVPDHR